MYWQHSRSTPRSPRWYQTDEVIKRWLKERDALFILYHALGQLLRSKHQPAIKAAIPKFCQILMDYIAAGHFRIFEKLAEAEAKCMPNASPDQNLLIKISSTTDVALTFNDTHVLLKNLNRLYQDLSYLGEQLANRRNWENALIREYLKITRAPLPPPAQEPPVPPSRPSI